MYIFKNFIVVFILVGLLTRALNYVFHKFIKGKSFYLTYILMFVVFCPLFAAFLGFDVVVAEYIFSILIWAVFDLIRKR